MQVEKKSIKQKIMHKLFICIGDLKALLSKIRTNLTILAYFISLLIILIA